MKLLEPGTVLDGFVIGDIGECFINIGVIRRAVAGFVEIICLECYQCRQLRVIGFIDHRRLNGERPGDGDYPQALRIAFRTFRFCPLFIGIFLLRQGFFALILGFVPCLKSRHFGEVSFNFLVHRFLLLHNGDLRLLHGNSLLLHGECPLTFGDALLLFGNLLLLIRDMLLRNGFLTLFLCFDTLL